MILLIVELFVQNIIVKFTKHFTFEIFTPYIRMRLRENTNDMVINMFYRSERKQI